MKRMLLSILLIGVLVTPTMIFAQGHGGYQYFRHPVEGSALIQNGSPSDRFGAGQPQALPAPGQSDIPAVPRIISPGCCVVLCCRMVERTEFVNETKLVPVTTQRAEYYSVPVRHNEKITTITEEPYRVKRCQTKYRAHRVGCGCYSYTVTRPYTKCWYETRTKQVQRERTVTAYHTEKRVRLVDEVSQQAVSVSVPVVRKIPTYYWKEVPCCNIVWHPCATGCCGGYWDIPLLATK